MSPHDKDEAVAAELNAHHRVMIEYLGRLSKSLSAAASSGIDAARARRDLEDWVRDVLAPHAEEEEVTTYRAAAELDEGRLLIKSMLAEHELIRQTAANMSAAANDIEAAAYGRVLFEIFDSHQRKENDLILPLLVASKEVSLAEVMRSGDAQGHDQDHDSDHGHVH